jgi:hypothetical protein
MPILTDSTGIAFFLHENIKGQELKSIDVSGIVLYLVENSITASKIIKIIKIIKNSDELYEFKADDHQQLFFYYGDEPVHSNRNAKHITHVYGISRAGEGKYTPVERTFPTHKYPHKAFEQNPKNQEGGDIKVINIELGDKLFRMTYNSDTHEISNVRVSKPLRVDKQSIPQHPSVNMDGHVIYPHLLRSVSRY